MDSSHVALVSLMMKQEMFEHYRADRTISLGMNLASLTKVLKCSGNDDVVTLKAEDTADTVTVMFESKSARLDFPAAAFHSSRASCHLRQETRIPVVFRRGPDLGLRDEADGHRQRAPRHPRHRLQRAGQDAVGRVPADLP